MTTKRGNFVTLALRKEDMDNIDGFIEKHYDVFYNRPHVVRVALNDLFKKYKYKFNGGKR